jgi:hypothetical protein
MVPEQKMLGSFHPIISPGGRSKMASFQKRSGSWRAIVKRKGFDRITRTFDTKASAEAWARQIEAEMDRGVFVSRKE